MRVSVLVISSVVGTQENHQIVCFLLCLNRVRGDRLSIALWNVFLPDAYRTGRPLTIRSEQDLYRTAESVCFATHTNPRCMPARLSAAVFAHAPASIEYARSCRRDL